MLKSILGASTIVLAFAIAPSGSGRGEVVESSMTGGCAHEPPGLVELFDQDWSELPPVNGEDAHGWSVRSKFERARRLSIVQDPSAPRSPGGVIQGLFPAGAKGGSAPFRLSRRFEMGVSRMYFCIYTKIDPRFTNNGNTGTKFGFFLTEYHSGPERLNHYMNLTPQFGVNLQSDKGRLNRNIRSRFNMLRQSGSWHKIELVVNANTGGLPNGSVQAWVDDRPVLNEFNVQFFYPGQKAEFVGVTWNPTYGGGHNPVPYDMYQWIDNWYGSGE